jgi:putative ABC transport system ATP-binding protein
VNVVSYSSSEPLVIVERLERFYRRGSEEVRVLEEVDLEVGHAEFLALMGPSGSGKSTLLNILGGLDQASAGSVSIAGERIDQLSTQELAAWRAEHVGYVFQFYNLFQALSAVANVELPLLLTSLSRRERKQRAELALSMVGLSHRLRHYPKQLSGGEQQRVGIARAIVTDPTLLLCDEPTGDLDRKSGDEVLNLLEHLRAEHGKTIIMVTHDPHASARAGRTIYLNKGRLSPDLQD